VTLSACVIFANSKLADALKLKSCKLEFLDLSHNRLKEQVIILGIVP
jgi:hypothetical protein